LSGIALLGSCVTRDALRTPGRGDPPMTVVSRTGFASLLAPPIAGLTLPAALKGLKPDGFSSRCVRADIEKTGLDLIERQCPDILLLDFMDDRLPLLSAGGSVFCESQEFQGSGLAALEPFASGRSIDRLTGEAWQLWLDGLKRFRKRVRTGPLSSARLVLHCSYLALRWKPGAEEAARLALMIGTPAARTWMLRCNALFARLHHVFVEAFPETVVVEVPRALRVADGGHIWGPGPFHYTKDYYTAFVECARAQGIDLESPDD
jgi:hypothetical protein